MCRVLETENNRSLQMSDFYRQGFEQGYGWPKRSESERETPRSDGDRYSEETGREDGARRRRISEDLDRYE